MSVEPNGSGRYTSVVALTLVALLIAVTLSALPQFGLVWDEALGDLFFGHRVIDVDHIDPNVDFGHWLPVDGNGVDHPNLFLSPLRTRPWEHWPVMGGLSAWSCELFARRLHWLDPIDAHHLSGALVVAMLVLAMVHFLASSVGTLPAAIAAFTLITHPRFLGATWTDLKDSGSATFISISLLYAHRALTGARPFDFVMSGLSAGLALGTKLNVLFMPLPLGLFAWWCWPSLRFGQLARRWFALILAPLLAIAVLLLVWPWLQLDPVAHMRQSLSYVSQRATAGESTTPWGSPWPLLLAICSWPLATLPLVIAGAGVALSDLRRREPTLAALALLAALIPVARLSAPGVLSFDGYRHGLELVPALALLAGPGASSLLVKLRARSRGAVVAMCTVIAIGPLLELRAVHPFEVAHMSPLVGGPAGAHRLGFPQVEDYWASSYRRGMLWLRDNAEPEAAIAAGVAEHLLFIEGPVRLDATRRLVRASSPFRPDPGSEVRDQFAAVMRERPIYLLYIDREGWRNPIIEAADEMHPVWRERIGSRVFVKIVRFSKNPS